MQRRTGVGDISPTKIARKPEGASRIRVAHDLEYVWEGMNSFAKRWRVAQLAQAGTYELVEVPTKRGLTRALLFPKAILRAEFDADAPMREAMRIKRERLKARRATRQRK